MRKFLLTLAAALALAVTAPTLVSAGPVVGGSMLKALAEGNSSVEKAYYYGYRGYYRPYRSYGYYRPYRSYGYYRPYYGYYGYYRPYRNYGYYAPYRYYGYNRPYRYYRYW
jgi:hypothetical protein